MHRFLSQEKPPTTQPKKLELEALIRNEHLKAREYQAIRAIGALAIGLAVLAGIDTFVGEYIWGGTNPEVATLEISDTQHSHAQEVGLDDTISSFDVKPIVNSSTLVISGFGVDNNGAKDIAKAISPGLSELGEVAYLENSDEGINMHDIETKVVRYIKKNDIKTLYLYGHSMGGIEAIELADRLIDDVHIGGIFLDCTPASYEDVRGHDKGGTKLLQTLDELHLHLGPGARFVMEATRPILNNTNALFATKTYIKAFHQTNPDKGSNKLLQDQASIIRTFNPVNERHTFPDSLPIFRLRPLDYDNDHTINNKTSLPRWEKGLDHKILDIPLGKGENGASYHASDVSTPDVYNKALHEIADQLLSQSNDRPSPSDDTGTHLVAKP